MSVASILFHVYVCQCSLFFPCYLSCFFFRANTSPLLLTDYSYFTNKLLLGKQFFFFLHQYERKKKHWAFTALIIVGYAEDKGKKKMEKSKIKLFLQFFKNLNSTAVRNKFKKPIQRNSKPMQRNSFNTVTNIRVLASFRGTYATRPSLQAKKKS